MLPPDRTWSKCPGASADALRRLRAAAGIDLPVDYLDLLSFSNGGEGPIPVMPYNFCLDSAEDAARYKAERTYEEFFPGFFIFGGNGGGEYIALDLRGPKPWPVVAIDMTNIDLSENVALIAPDFASFLAFVGVEKAGA
jgi:SMI1 / KNR4 family (SUKH-1)